MKEFTVSVFRLRHIDKSGKRQVAFRIRSKYLQCSSLDILPSDLWYRRVKFTDSQYEAIKNAGYYGDIIECKTILEDLCRKLIKEHQSISKDSIVIEYRKYRVEHSTKHYNQNLNNKELRFSPDEFELFEELEDELASNSMVNDEDDSFEIYLEEYRQKHENKKRELDYLQKKKTNDFIIRAEADYSYCAFDKGNLLLSIGDLFLIKKQNGSYEYPKLYRGILKELYDFILTTDHSNNILDFNMQFCLDLLCHIRDAGIIKTSINKTPHELNSELHDSFFFEADRKVCSHDTFKDKVKAVNKIIKMLRSHRDINLNFDDLNARNFLHVTTSKIGARSLERLEVDEVLELIDYDSKDEELRKTCDLFLILVFCGGVRGIKNIQIHPNKESDYIKVLHNKTKTPVESPIIEELKPILERYNWVIPHVPEETISVNLRTIAKDLNWNREVKYINTSINRDLSTQFYRSERLDQCLSQRFARKTFVHYMRMVYNLSDRDIIEYTGHSSITTLQHYAGAPNLTDRRKKLQEKNSQY